MSVAYTKSSLLRAWGRLLRLPNLLTVPGDPLVGFLIVTKGNERGLLGAYAVAASLCFYTAGLIMNDICDIPTDRRERPDRPLPSGQIPPLTAAMVALALLGSGLGCCRLLDPQAWWVGFLLVVTIFLYDLGLKKIPVLGPLAMGACRGLSVLLGAFAIPATEPLAPTLCLAIATITGYVAVVTHMARREMVASPVNVARWAPKEFKPWNVPFLIGLLLSGLLWIQAGFIMVAGAGTWGIVVGLVLMGLWPFHRVLDKQFHAS